MDNRNSGMKETRMDDILIESISYPVFKNYILFIYTDTFEFDPGTG